MQIVVYIDDMCKTKCVLGSLFMNGRYGFLLQRFSHGGVPDLEFNGVSGVLSRSDSFSDKSFTFGEPPWMSAKVHISDGAALSSGEEPTSLQWDGELAGVGD
ncbi:Pentatricopeptide repeat-containing protein [Hordeum vulgare]|nr:Pentatricopeptide repeat-containing protein [Hordeum vulgare]